MSKGYTAYQLGIIKRFYEHADARTLTALQELVSELYLATSAKKADALWARAGQLLERAGANEAQAAELLGKRDVAALATIVGDVLKNKR